jgi:hypothetical protein
VIVLGSRWISGQGMGTGCVVRATLTVAYAVNGMMVTLAGWQLLGTF